MLWSSNPINTNAFEYFPALKRIRDYFELNYCEPICLKKAAAIAGLEEKYFSKVFRTYIGVGFKEWTDFVRVEKAMDAIRREDQSLTTVGFSVGFQSSATFQRCFKKHAGMRPSEFKRSIVDQLVGSKAVPPNQAA